MSFALCTRIERGACTGVPTPRGERPWHALLELLDERAARERRSRSTLIREAIEDYLRDDLAAEIDRRIVEGYRRRPQTRGAGRCAY
jgi:hypothetical protein